jgi:outer membrane protein assembly factor BamD (BamD/ComL family)
MKSALPGVLRLIAFFLLGGGILLGGLDAYGAARMVVSPDESMAGRLPMLAEAVAIVLGLGGLGALLYGVAGLLEVADTNPAGNPARQSDVPDKAMLQAMAELHTAIDRLPATLQAQIAASHLDQSHPTALEETGAPVRDTGSPEIAESMRLVLGMLEEIRELALLNDAQRQQRLAGSQKQRRDQLLTEIKRLLASERWGAADKMLTLFDDEFPRDPETSSLKAHIADARRHAEQKSLAELQKRVEDLVAVASWERAYAETAVFVENFPANRQGKDLLARVVRERDVHLESTANRLYAEIKADIERRNWRRALANARKLLERSPRHRRSAVIREQFKTIQENAEIEERQEQERRIQELMRSKQFPQAIDLAEDLLERFPNSPQAESLQQLLPKMRELAIEKEIESET